MTKTELVESLFKVLLSVGVLNTDASTVRPTPPACACTLLVLWCWLYVLSAYVGCRCWLSSEAVQTGEWHGLCPSHQLEQVCQYYSIVLLLVQIHYFLYVVLVYCAYWCLPTLWVAYEKICLCIQLLGSLPNTILNALCTCSALLVPSIIIAIACLW